MLGVVTFNRCRDGCKPQPMALCCGRRCFSNKQSRWHSQTWPVVASVGVVEAPDVLHPKTTAGARNIP